MDVAPGTFYLGGEIDPKTGERTEEVLLYDSPDLTTHGVIVGMTGSGKTGLGLGMMEEALLNGIATLMIDPKGDMGNLLLLFPELRPEDFRPWIDEARARREGTTPEDLAARTAESWRKGLAGWDITPDRIAKLRDAAPMTIYTPGSTAGVAVNVLGSLDPPDLSWDTEAEVLRDEIEAYVSSLLTLAGVESDPVSGREHVLLANIIEASWREGRAIDLAGLLGQIAQPPFRKLGVFEVDAFFPEKDRTALAMKLNGLAASPSFAAWLEGTPLDIGAMLFPEGKPAAAILYLAHLSDSERQFAVTLFLSKLVTWMRRQSGTSDLRALVYMDEMFGFCPPTAEPPSKKPILTLLKQARAFGVGFVASTQNPVDLDYKAMSNAGTWMVGRLQTGRDKARILEGMTSAGGTVDAGAIDPLISGLGKRQFVMHKTGGKPPITFATRWAMCFLAGPLTRDSVAELMAGREPPTPAPEEAPTPAAEPAPAEQEPETAVPDAVASASPPPGASATPPVVDDETVPAAPEIAASVRSAFLDPAATWASAVGATPGSTTLRPGVAATVHLRYDDTAAGVDHQETYEAMLFPLGAAFDPGTVHAVDHDPRDLRDDAPPGAGFALTDVPLDKASHFTDLSRRLADHLYRSRTVTVFRNKGLKLFSRVGEARQEFEARCREAAETAADADTAKLEEKYRTRIRSVQAQLSKAESRVRELESEASSRNQQSLVEGAGELLGALLGGKMRSTSLSKMASQGRQAAAAGARLRTAQEAMGDKATEVEQLEADLAEDLGAITAKWSEAADQVEEMEIGLEKTDVSVDDLVLVWVPS